MKCELFSARRNLVLALAVLPLAAGCDDVLGNDDDARVQIELTDAPADYIESAEVWISRVYLQGSEGADSLAQGGRVDLFNDPTTPFHVDLLLLQDGTVAELTDAVDVPAGSYQGLRIVVDSALVTLAEGYEFEDGTTTAVLKIPSGVVKVQLDGDIAAEEGATTILLVDFDVNQNFVIQGNPDSPAGIQGILFTPVLRELDRAEEES